MLEPYTQLTAQFEPVELTVTNDSWQHRHHAPMRAQNGGNGETRKSHHRSASGRILM